MARPRKDKYWRELDWVAANLTNDDVTQDQALSPRAWNRLQTAQNKPDKFWTDYNAYQKEAKKLQEATLQKQLEVSGEATTDDSVGIAQAEEILKKLKTNQKKNYDFLRPPQDPIENMEWRIALRKICQKDPEARKAVKAKCTADVCYFFQGFCFLFEPRPKPKKIPFILWDHQVPVVKAMDKNLGFNDIGIEKSRAEGASWMFLMMFLHRWLFEPYTTFGLVSRTEDAVDLKDDPDSLMWKYDFQLDHLPPWLMPHRSNIKRSYGSHTLINLENHASITGYSAVGDVASGGRKTAMAMDELAKFPKGQDYDAMNSTQYVTDCRVFVSTPKGNTGAYYDVMHEEGNLIKLVLDWKDNSSKNRGLYRVSKDGLVQDLNASCPLSQEERRCLPEVHRKLRKKGHKIDGKVRSPWYDKECLRGGASPQGIAQELDRDYGGSEAQLFGEDAQAIVKSTTRPPFRNGLLGYHSETYSPLWENRNTGDFFLWHHLHNGRPLESKFVIGCDISSGLGGTMTSNSVLQVIDLVGCAQVAEYAVNTIKPVDFAELALATCRWYWNASFIWEENGQAGSAFHARFLELGYGNIYYREAGHKGLGRALTQKPAFMTSDRNKPEIIANLDYAIRSSELKIHSVNTQKELGDYILKDGKIVQAKAVKTSDDSSKGAAHGDRVMALALAWHFARNKDKGEEIKAKQEAPYGSAMWRRNERKREQREASLW